jgi:hypothetical protein
MARTAGYSWATALWGSRTQWLQKLAALMGADGPEAEEDEEAQALQ